MNGIDTKTIKQKINKNTCKLIRKITKKGEKEIEKQNIRVGDILYIKKGQFIPADCIILSSQKLIYLQTDLLDGETDWRIREAIDATQKLNEDNLLFQKQWRVRVEPPSDKIYTFSGLFKNYNGELQKIELINTVWKNMKLVSDDVQVIVIYCGKETKTQMNASQKRKKYGKTDVEINDLMKLLGTMIVSIAILFFILSENRINFGGLQYIIKIFILCSDIIPVSLRVNIEMAKSFFGHVIQRDKSLKGIICRDSCIPEELGRIEYILTDKTGTLTKNKMKLKKIITNSRSYGVNELSKIQDFFNKDSDLERVLESFMVCNNVNPCEVDGRIVLQASSQDELALTKYSEQIGIQMISRNSKNIFIQQKNQQNEKYEILKVFPFSSESKKMGILIKNKDQIIFYEKGADEVMKKNFNPLSNSSITLEETDMLAAEGYRIMVFGYRIINQNEKFINYSIKDFEKDMKFLAITAVEDKLQNEVKNTILTLIDAGIKIWMLTGDKLETAVSISITGGFKSHGDSQIIFSSINDDLEDKIRNFENINVVYIEGQVVEYILQRQSLKNLFFNKIQYSKSVIISRCSPKLKSQVTKIIRKEYNKIVCSIGDGGNDVGMIQEASLGLGIEGKEGKQASLASDYSLVQFRHILKLILWHGRQNYVRQTQLVNFIIHRGLLISIMQVYFLILQNYLCISFYNGFLKLGYTSVFTSFAIFSLILDHDLPINVVYSYPILYKYVQEGHYLTTKIFFIFLFKAIFQAEILLIFSQVFFDLDHRSLVTVSYTSLILIQYLLILTWVREWNRTIILSCVISFLVYFISYIYFRNLLEINIFKMEDIAYISILTLCGWLPFYLLEKIKSILYPDQITKVLNEEKYRKTRKTYDFSKELSFIKQLYQFNTNNNS